MVEKRTWWVTYWLANTPGRIFPGVWRVTLRRKLHPYVPLQDADAIVTFYHQRAYEFINVEPFVVLKNKSFLPNKIFNNNIHPYRINRITEPLFDEITRLLKPISFGDRVFESN